MDINYEHYDNSVAWDERHAELEKALQNASDIVRSDRMLQPEQARDSQLAEVAARAALQAHRQTARPAYNPEELRQSLTKKSPSWSRPEDVPDHVPEDKKAQGLRTGKLRKALNWEAFRHMRGGLIPPNGRMNMTDMKLSCGPRLDVVHSELMIRFADCHITNRMCLADRKLDATDRFALDPWCGTGRSERAITDVEGRPTHEENALFKNGVSKKSLEFINESQQMLRENVVDALCGTQLEAEARRRPALQNAAQAIARKGKKGKNVKFMQDGDVDMTSAAGAPAALGPDSLGSDEADNLVEKLAQAQERDSEKRRLILSGNSPEFERILLQTQMMQLFNPTDKVGIKKAIQKDGMGFVKNCSDKKMDIMTKMMGITPDADERNMARKHADAYYENMSAEAQMKYNSKMGIGMTLEQMKQAAALEETRRRAQQKLAKMQERKFKESRGLPSSSSGSQQEQRTKTKAQIEAEVDAAMADFSGEEDQKAPVGKKGAPKKKGNNKK